MKDSHNGPGIPRVSEQQGDLDGPPISHGMSTQQHHIYIEKLSLCFRVDPDYTRLQA